MGNCNQICTNDKEQYIEHQQLKTTDHPSQLLTEQFTLKCEICGQQRSHSSLKTHLDLCHFVQVKQKQTPELLISCLLCGYRSSSLQLHKIHLKKKHQYMQNQSKKNAQQQIRNHKLQLNQNIKNRIKKIQKIQYNLVPGTQNKAEIDNRRYQIDEYKKQYGAIQFDQQVSEGDLVWRYLFSQNYNAQFYSMEFQPKQKTILAISKIFTPI